jgi:hypothetical protein
MKSRFLIPDIRIIKMEMVFLQNIIEDLMFDNLPANWNSF